MARNTLLNITFVALCLVLLTVPAAAQYSGSRTVPQRLDQIERQIQTISRYIYRGEGQPPSPQDNSQTITKPSGAGLADINVRLDTLESQIRELTGQLEEQNYLLGQLGNRLDKVEKEQEELAAAQNQAKETSAPKTESVSPAELQALRRSMESLRQTVTRLEQQNSRLIRSQTGRDNNESGNRDTGQPTDLSDDDDIINDDTKPDKAEESSPDTPPTPDNQDDLERASAQAAYDRAFSLLKDNEYKKARTAFQTFVSEFPDHDLYENAYYWLGETYYVLKDYQTAARIFARGYQDTPHGNKAQDNLLKLALSLKGLDKVTDACVTLRQLETAFDELRPAIKKRVMTEKERFGCS